MCCIWLMHRVTIFPGIEGLCCNVAKGVASTALFGLCCKTNVTDARQPWLNLDYS